MIKEMKRLDIFKYIGVLSVAVVGLASCNDKLDEVPDNRTEIDTPEKVALLLTSAYPSAVPAVICELSGDNFVDNNVVKPGIHRAAYSLFHEEAYRWKDIKNYGIGEDDTPYAVWEGFYKGIATANHAIEAMEAMSADPAHDATLSHSWGEAHLVRAYLHFVLVNVFAEAYKDSVLSQQDMAIPYVTKPENVVHVDYSQPEFRHSVKETYDLIEKDLLEGINLVDDSKYKVPAYHFNRNAANAFAARFYLYKREYAKCIKYADACLGTNPSSSLRKWASMSTNTKESMLKAYNDEQAACNYLLQTTYSLQDRMLSAIRFVINDGNSAEKVKSSKNAIYGSGPNWSNRLPAYDGKIYRYGENDDGSWLFRVYEYFEYDDKIAGIGWVHIIYQPFTAEETLLCRAEAELYLGQSDKALQDLNAWTKSKLVDTPLTQARINSFYGGDPATNDYVSEINPDKMSPSFKVLTGDDLNILSCILHFRRVETMFEGLRWFDIKRYGIKVHHAYRGERDYNVTHDYLDWNDPRRVLQIPNNVISAGYPSTYREAPTSNETTPMTVVPKLYTTNLQ